MTSVKKISFVIAHLYLKAAKINQNNRFFSIK